MNKILIRKVKVIYLCEQATQSTNEGVQDICSRSQNAGLVFSMGLLFSFDFRLAFCRIFMSSTRESSRHFAIFVSLIIRFGFGSSDCFEIPGFELGLPGF
uniref:Uncharacterized protein n=1 Tax=Glycine max TaxID=3847 RepID=C6T9T1_SOYBN|nr:unknown [Glycine max]